MQITLPYGYSPRPYQLPFWRHMEGGGKRYMGVWHRRAGKDHTMFAWTTKAAFQRIGLYWHVYPTYEMGRKNLWNASARDGMRFMSMFPDELVKRRSDQIMMTELVNGSIHQVVGSDDPDRLRGSNPVGVVMSEYSLQNPDAWNVLSPILAENDGWAVFNLTPAGRNHAWDMLQNVRRIPSWLTEVLTVNDTTLDDGVTPVVRPETIEEERATGRPEPWIQQEYYCNFDSPYAGAIYGDVMTELRRRGRIGSVPHNPDWPVDTWWDIGINDKTAIWFVQSVGQQRRFIRCETGSDRSLDQWIAFVLAQPYVYRHHVGPWDLEHREQSTGQQRVDFARRLGINFEVAPRSRNIAEDIHQVRRYLLRYECVFDQALCQEGLDQFAMYRWKSGKDGQPTETPEHQHSHAPDAFRHGVVVGLDQRGSNGMSEFAGEFPVRAGRYDATRPHLEGRANGYRADWGDPSVELRRRHYGHQQQPMRGRR